MQIDRFFNLRGSSVRSISALSLVTTTRRTALLQPRKFGPLTMLLARAKLAFSRAGRATSALLRVFERSYEPSKYYMRGPGPKAREAATRVEQPAAGRTEASAHG